MSLRYSLRRRGSGGSSSSSNPFRSIELQGSTNPASSLTLGGSQDGLVIYVDEAIALGTDPGAYGQIYVREGSNVTMLGGVWKQAYCYRAYNAGVSIGLGITDAWGTPLEGRFCKVVPVTVPASIDSTPPATDITIPIVPDWTTYDRWSPDRAHLVLPADIGWFWIDATGATTQAILYMREMDDTNGDWGPVRVIVIAPGRLVPVCATFRHVAFATDTLQAVSVRVPVGSSITSAVIPNSLDLSADFVTRRVVPVSTAGEIQDAFTNLAHGDRIRITGNISGAGLLSKTSFAGDVMIEGPDYSVPDTVTLGASILIGVDSNSRRVVMSGFKLSNATGVTAPGIEVRGGDVSLQHLIAERTGGTASEVIRLDGNVGGAVFEAFNVDAQGNGTNTTDIWGLHTSGSGGSTRTSALLIGCKGSTPGSGINENLLTPHGKFTMEARGGLYTNAGGGPAVIGSSTDCKTILAGLTVSKGSGSSVRIGGSASPDVSAFGCEFSGLESNVSCAIPSLIGSRVTVATDNKTYAFPVSTEPNYLWLGNRFIGSGSGGVLFRLECLRFQLIGNHATGIDYWVIGEVAGGASRLWNNTLGNSNGIQREDVAATIDWLFSSLGVYFSAAQASTNNTKNINGDGNIGTDHPSALFGTGTNQRNTAAATANYTGSPSGFESDSVTPSSGSNLWWDHANFAGGLSGGADPDVVGSAAKTLRDRLEAGAGFMDAFGRALYLGRRISRGAYARQVASTGDRLFPMIA